MDLRKGSNMARGKNVPKDAICTVENLRKSWQEIDFLADYDKGFNWYNQAQQECIAAANELLINPFAFIAVAALISPGMPWEANIEAAKASVKAWQAGLEPKDAKLFMPSLAVLTWKFHAKAHKALDIMLSCLPDELNDPIFWHGVVCGLNPNGPKVPDFAHCLYFPDSSPVVCVDSHTYAIGAGIELPGSWRMTPKQYTQCVGVFIEFALELGILPLRLQAILWEARRRQLDNPNIRNLKAKRAKLVKFIEMIAV
jgi:hypothetical protein